MMRKLLYTGLLVSTSVFAEVTSTTLVTVNPPIPSEPVKQGVCWNTSIAAPRFGAWVCGSGSESYDPCFSQPNVSNAVVCGVDPAHNKPGFRLNLSESLPFSLGVPPLPGEAWMIQLENGIICTKASGPAKIIQGVGTIAFICEEPGLPAGVFSGILRQMNLGPIWNVHWVHYTVQNGQYNLQTDLQQINLQTVWR